MEKKIKSEKNHGCYTDLTYIVCVYAPPELERVH